MNRINILVICMVLFFMTGNACATEWISSEDLITSDFHLMTADERNVVKAATDDSMEAAYMLKEISAGIIIMVTYHYPLTSAIKINWW